MEITLKRQALLEKKKELEKELALVQSNLVEIDNTEKRLNQ